MSPTDAPGAPELDPVVDLAATDGFAPLRWLDRFGPPVSARHRTDQVRAALGEPSFGHLEVGSGSAVAGALLWRPVPDLAQHFEVPVHEVVAVLAGADADRHHVVVQLLDGLSDELAGDGGLTMLRIEADDRAGLAAAAASGFEVFETSLSWVTDLERAHLNPPFDATGMQIHRFEDGPLPDRIRTVIHGAPVRVVDDHYHADPRLPTERCDALYVRQRDRVLEGIGADVVVYHEHEGEVTGFGTFKRATEVAPYGVALLDGAIGFQFPNAPAGQSNASAAFMCSRPLLDNRLVEWGTQVTNYRMVNMLAGRRSVRLCRSSYVLHRWNDAS